MTIWNGRAETPRRRTSVGMTAAIVYVHLWVLEGAARKWLPPTATGLYYSRVCLIAIAIVILLVSKGQPRRRSPILTTALIAVICLLALIVCLQVIVVDLAPTVGVIGFVAGASPLLL